MNPLAQAIKDPLSAAGLSQKDFSELLIRLLDYGVLSRDESQIEASLYDRYLQCADLVEDYLRMIHVTLLHDRTFRFIRVFPPGAEVPGVADNDNLADGPFQSGFRSKPNPQTIAVILVLRVEYEKALREGKVGQDGGVLIPLEQLNISLKHLLKQGLPITQAERTALFQQLKQLRLIKINTDNDLLLGNTDDSWLRIEPSITSFVTQAMLDSLYPPECPESEHEHSTHKHATHEDPTHQDSPQPKQSQELSKPHTASAELSSANTPTPKITNE